MKSLERTYSVKGKMRDEGPEEEGDAQRHSAGGPVGLFGVRGHKIFGILAL